MTKTFYIVLLLLRMCTRQDFGRTTSEMLKVTTCLVPLAKPTFLQPSKGKEAANHHRQRLQIAIHHGQQERVSERLCGVLLKGFISCGDDCDEKFADSDGVGAELLVTS